MNFKTIIPYIIIIVLGVIVCLKQCKAPIQLPPKEIKTIQVVHFHDTLPGDTIRLKKTIHDTMWVDSGKYKPANTYDGLLKQYDSLGDKYFSKNIFSTKYSLGKYGTATSTDTIVQNTLLSSSLSYDITFTDTIKTECPQTPLRKQLYIGGNLFASKKEINSLYGGLLYKDKKDNIYQLNIGINNNGEVLYGVGLYYKIKLK